MKSVIALVINGSTFYFENENFNTEQENKLNEIALTARDVYPELKDLSDNEICDWFVSIVKDQFNISLEKVGVAFVVRLNRYY